MARHYVGELLRELNNRAGTFRVRVHDELHRRRVARALRVERQPRLPEVAVLAPTGVLDAGALQGGVERGDGRRLGVARRAGLRYRGAPQARDGGFELCDAGDLVELRQLQV